jgi:uncharacterized protein
VNRQDVEFASDGEKCAAWFFPANGAPGGQRPCVVLAHGLGGTRELRLSAYAERFAAAGYHALVFDYRHFGASTGKPRQLLDIQKQHQDWHAAIEFARSRSEVDPVKIVLWGSSLSGGHVLAVAARDANVAAVISQVPHFDGPASVGAIPLKTSLRLSWHAMVDLLRSALGRTPHYVPLCANPGELGLISGAGEAAAFRRLIPEGAAFDGRVAARFVMAVTFYSPGRSLKTLQIPVLVQIAEQDVTTPTAPVVRACQSTKVVTLLTYPTGHFQPYVEPMFTKVVSDQLSFLTQHVAPTSGTSRSRDAQRPIGAIAP